MSRPTARRVVVAGARSAVGPAVTIALVVLVVAGVLAAWPRLVDRMATAELRYQLDGLSAATRDPSGQTNVWLGGPIPSGAEQTLPDELWPVWGGWETTLRDARDDVDEPVRSALGDPQYHVVSTDAVTLGVPDHVTDRVAADIRWAADPFLLDHVEMVEGVAPAPVPEEGLTTPAVGGRPDIEVMMSARSAEEMRWSVGERRTFGGFGAESVGIVLTGTFDAHDSDEDYWQHLDSVIFPFIDDDPNSGISVVARAYVNPTTETFRDLTFSGWTSTAWLPFDTSPLTASTARASLAELEELVATPVPTPVEAGVATPFVWETDTVSTLDEVIGRSAGLSAVFALVASGPIGVALAVIALSGRLLLDRRRNVLALALARGASGWQLRSVMALEGLLLGVPAAVVGVAAAVLLVPADVGLASFVLPALVALAPAVTLGGVTNRRGLRPVREDLGTRGSRWRGVAELVLLVVTVAAVALLAQRGLVASADDAGVDPLIAATPLLLAMCTAVATMRLYPPVVLALGRRLRGGRGLVGSLGATRAARSPVPGLAPALAVVVGVAITVFAALLLPSIRTGTEAAALAQVGADLRLTGPVVTDEQLAQIAELDGVSDVSPVANNGTTQVREGTSGVAAPVYAVDMDALARIQADVPGAAHIPSGSGEWHDGELPVVASSELVPNPDGDWQLILDDAQPLDVVATQAEAGGITAQPLWLLADRALLSEVTRTGLAPRLVLVGLDADADADAVAEQVQQIVASPSVVTMPGGVLAEFDASPVVSGMRTGLVLTIGIAALLAGLACVLTLAIAAPARTRLVAVLRTLGLRPRQEVALVLWEIVPLLAMSVLTGGVLGVGLTALVMRAVDLRPFTGGPVQPAIVVDGSLLALVIGGLLVAVALAVAVSALVARRRAVATVLRVGEDT